MIECDALKLIDEFIKKSQQQQQQQKQRANYEYSSPRARCCGTAGTDLIDEDDLAPLPSIMLQMHEQQQAHGVGQHPNLFETSFDSSYYQSQSTSRPVSSSIENNSLSPRAETAINNALVHVDTPPISPPSQSHLADLVASDDVALETEISNSKTTNIFQNDFIGNH